jgi:hypothetical protein
MDYTGADYWKNFNTTPDWGRDLQPAQSSPQQAPVGPTTNVASAPVTPVTPTMPMHGTGQRADGMQAPVSNLRTYTAPPQGWVAPTAAQNQAVTGMAPAPSFSAPPPGWTGPTAAQNQAVTGMAPSPYTPAVAPTQNTQTAPQSMTASGRYNASMTPSVQPTTPTTSTPAAPVTPTAPSPGTAHSTGLATIHNDMASNNNIKTDPTPSIRQYTAPISRQRAGGGLPGVV